jgi:hypothetical protein
MFDIFEYIFNLFRWFPPIFNAMMYVMTVTFAVVLYEEGYLINEMLIIIIVVVTGLAGYVFRRIAVERSKKNNNGNLINRFNSFYGQDT